ncbi:MAG: two-component sensor histidine kinase [Hyphomicrobiales bacterium]|nr:MAG: two-component sensor histidine kinase [Hyphomicrobiales bacterium]
MSGVDDQMGRNGPDNEVKQFARRLFDARWPVLTAIAVLAAAVFTAGLPLGFAATGAALVVLSAAMLQPRRPVETAAPKEEKRSPVWPSTSMKSVVEALPQPCFITDGRGIVRYANAAVDQELGAVRPGDPLSFKLRMPSFLEALDRVAAGKPAERIRWSEKVPTERLFEAYITSLEVPSARRGRAGPHPDFVLVVVHDLTEQHRLERMRADFVANASHELRTPLASLTGFIDTLQGPAKDDPNARERFLGIMRDQAGRMARLIDDLLSLSRIEMRAHVRPTDPVDMTAALTHVADALTPLAEENGVVIEKELPADPLIVRGDRDELVQVFENLTENAIKYGGSGGRVRIGARRVRENGGPERIAVSVRDWGQGIAEEHVPRLTERFYRVDVVTSREQKGTGLGLAIVKHILARHRGRLAVESEPGEGSTFTVWLDSGESVAKDSNE